MADFADTYVTTRGRGSQLARCVTAASGGVVTVDIGGQWVNVRTSRGLLATANDIVVVQRLGSQMVATAIVYESSVALIDPLDPAYPQAAPDVRPTTKTGVYVIHPVDTGTYRTGVGWRTDTQDLFQGDPSGNGYLQGAAFYGTKPRALTGATITKAVLKVKRLSAGSLSASTPTLRLVSESTRPGGAPTLGSSASGPSLLPGQEADIDIGTTWGQGIVDGTSGGIAIYVAATTPYIRLAGKSGWAAAMTLVLNWSRDA